MTLKIEHIFYRSLSFCIVVLFFNTHFAYGQEDSIAFKTASAAFDLAFSNPDSALFLAGSVLSTSGNNPPATANAYNAIGWAYMHKGHLDSSLFNLNKSLQLFSKQGSEYNMARLNINISQVYTRQSNFTQGLKYILRADSLSNILKDTGLQTDCKRQLGIIYRESGDTKKAAKYFEDAMKGYEAQKNYTKCIDVAVSLCILFKSMGQADSSLQIINYAIQLAQEHHASRYHKAMLQEHLGESYLMKKAYPQALRHFTNAYNSFVDMNNRGDIAYEALFMGKTLSFLSRYQEAEKYLFEAYTLSDSLDMMNFQVEISEALTGMYAQWGRWQQAFRYSQQTTVLKDSLKQAAQITATNEIKEKYEAEKKEAQIQLLRIKNNRIKWGFVASILGLALAGSMIWLYRSRRKIKEEKILNYFATSLYNQNTVDDVFWDIAKNCMSRFNFEDCVMYGYDDHRKMLVQKAAFGPKNPDGYTIANKIEIPLGKGIVGSVAASLKPEIITDTTKDARYIVDDQTRLSEIAVPIILDGKLLGIIDSEHSKKNFYTRRHLKLLQRIADTCTKKLTKYFVEDSIRKQIASDLHDDIGSELSSIDISSRTALVKKEDAGLVASHLKAISHQAQQTMENMSDIVWSINPDNDNFESMLTRMKGFATELCEPLDINLQFRDSLSNETPITLNSIVRKNVFLIFKEAVNNAAKYSACTLLTIRFAKNSHGRLIMEITDNGKGFDPATAKMGNGLRNMHNRAVQINAGIRIDSALNKGVNVELQLTV